MPTLPSLASVREGPAANLGAEDLPIAKQAADIEESLWAEG